MDPILDGRKLFYLPNQELLPVLGITNDVINKLKKKLASTQRFGRISVMYAGGSREVVGKGKKRKFEKKIQEYHLDYQMTAKKGYIVGKKLPSILPFTCHIPLTSAGSHLYIKDIEDPFHLKFGDILIVRGDVFHAGGIYDSDTYRIHIYIDTDVFIEDGTYIHV
jgi:hypothetical protein